MYYDDDWAYAYAPDGEWLDEDALDEEDAPGEEWDEDEDEDFDYLDDSDPDWDAYVLDNAYGPDEDLFEMEW